VLQVRGEIGQRGAARLAAVPDHGLDALLEALPLRRYTATTHTDVRGPAPRTLPAPPARLGAQRQEHEEGVISFGVPVPGIYGPIAASAEAKPVVVARMPDLMGFLDWLQDTTRRVGLRMPPGELL